MPYDPISRQFVHPSFVATHVREDGMRAMLHAIRDHVALYDTQHMSDGKPLRKSFLTRSDTGFYADFEPC
jgi:hypothetical protein